MQLTKTENSGRWQPGKSGNLNGRPVGSRHQFSAAFLRDLAEVWTELGRETMLSTAKTNPALFFATCARLLPANVELTIKETYGGLDATDFAILRAIREAIPGANQQQPSDVLRFVEEAIKAHTAAPMIEANPTDKQSAGSQ